MKCIRAADEKSHLYDPRSFLRYLSSSVKGLEIQVFLAKNCDDFTHLCRLIPVLHKLVEN